MRTLIASVIISLFVCTTAQAETFTELATKIVGKPITVTCKDISPNLGETYQYSDGSFDPLITLSPETCEGIRALDQHRIYSYMDEGNALATILHESFHIILKSGNESRVECVAMKNLWPWLARYKFNHRQTKRLYEEAWDQHFGLPGQFLHPGYGCDNMGDAYHLGVVTPMKRPVKKKK